jgi:hypothetical protein
MGVDLKMLVVDGHYPGVISFAHTMMETGQNYDFHNKVKKLPSEPVPDDFTSYVARDAEGESCYGQVRDDCYGERVRMVRAGDVVKLRYKQGYTRLKAAIAYLRELPPDTWVALYWH